MINLQTPILTSEVGAVVALASTHAVVVEVVHAAAAHRSVSSVVESATSVVVEDRRASAFRRGASEDLNVPEEMTEQRMSEIAEKR